MPSFTAGTFSHVPRLLLIFKCFSYLFFALSTDKKMDFSQNVNISSLSGNTLFVCCVLLLGVNLVLTSLFPHSPMLHSKPTALVEKGMRLKRTSSSSVPLLHIKWLKGRTVVVISRRKKIGF